MEKNPSANAAHPRAGKTPLEKKWNPLQCFVWRIPRTEEPGGLQYMGCERVRHDLVTKQQHNGYKLSEFLCSTQNILMELSGPYSS